MGDLAPADSDEIGKPEIGKKCVSRAVRTIDNHHFCRNDCKECDVCFGVTRIEDEYGFTTKFKPTSCGCLELHQHPRATCGAPHPPICAESCWRCAPCYEPLLKSDFIDVESTPVGHGDHCNGACGLYEGDCDFDTDCLHGLVCGVNNCGARLVNPFLNSRGVDIHPDGPPQRGGREPDCCVWPEDALGTSNRRGDSRLAWGEYQDYTLHEYGPYVVPTEPPIETGGSGAASAAAFFLSSIALLGVCALVARAALRKLAVDGSKYLSQYPIEDEERPMKSGKRGWSGMEDDEQPTRTSTPESSEHPVKVRDVQSALEKGDLTTKQPGRNRAAPALPTQLPKSFAQEQQAPLVDGDVPSDTRKPARRAKAVERSSTLGSLKADALPTKASLDYEQLSVRELKQRLGAAGVSTSGAVEVGDLVELLRQHDADQAATHRLGPPAQFPDGSPTRGKAKPAPPALFPDGSVSGSRAVPRQAPDAAASPGSSGQTRSSGTPTRSPNRRSSAAVKSTGGRPSERMPEQPPPLMGSPPRRGSAQSDASASVISAGQISAGVASTSRATSVKSRGSGRNSRKERKVAPRPSDPSAILADLM